MRLPLRKEKKIAIIKAHRTDFCVFMTYAGLKGAHIIHKSQGSPGTKLNGIDEVPPPYPLCTALLCMCLEAAEGQAGAEHAKGEGSR